MAVTVSIVYCSLLSRFGANNQAYVEDMSHKAPRMLLGKHRTGTASFAFCPIASMKGAYLVADALAARARDPELRAGPFGTVVLRADGRLGSVATDGGLRFGPVAAFLVEAVEPTLDALTGRRETEPARAVAEPAREEGVVLVAEAFLVLVGRPAAPLCGVL